MPGSGLRSDEPSVLWVIVALVGAEFDAAQIARSLKVIAPFTKNLDNAANLAKFEKGVVEMEKLGKLNARIASRLKKVAASRKAFAEAETAIHKALKGKLYAFPGPILDPEVFPQLVKMAYHLSEQGVIAFEKFLLEIEKRWKLAGLSAKFTDEEIAALKKAWEKGRKEGGHISANEVKSLVKLDSKLLKLARETFEGNNLLQKEANSLIEQLSKGNMNPGIGSKNIGKNIFEARSRGGARVYFRNGQNGTEILGYSNKANQQQVIDRILQIY